MKKFHVARIGALRITGQLRTSNSKQCGTMANENDFEILSDKDPDLVPLEDIFPEIGKFIS